MSIVCACKVAYAHIGILERKNIKMKDNSYLFTNQSHKSKFTSNIMMRLSKASRRGHGPAFCIIMSMECRSFNMITKKDDQLYDCLNL